MEFITPSLDLNNSSSDKEFFDEINVEHQIAVQVAITCVNTWEFFTQMELEEGGGQFVDPNIGVWDVLATMQTMPSLFKSFTNFSLTEFKELAQLVVPTIIGHVRSIGEPHHIYGRPSKLTHNSVCSTSYCISNTRNQIWCIPMEVEEDCNKWWWHFYCILHQFHHCRWNLMVHYWRVLGLGYALP